MVVHPALPVKSVKEMVALAGKRPGELRYGSAGMSAMNHLAGEIFSEMTHKPNPRSVPREARVH